MKLPLFIEMHDPQGTILWELKYGMPQSSVAITYAYLMAQEGDSADWATVNAAIQKRWSGKSALARVKKQAWKIYEKWASDLIKSGHLAVTP